MPPAGDALVLAVDLGSSAVKVGLATPEGAVVAWNSAPLHTDYGPGGRVTQDAEVWWKLVTGSARRALATGGVDGGRVAAVCVTGQWASTVPVDVAGKPVGPCLMWSDTEGEGRSRALVGGHVQGYRARALTTWVRRSAGVPSTSGADPVGHMLHLQLDEPAVAQAARWYLEPVDALAMRFSGVAAATPASMTAAWLTDNRHPARLAYDATLVRRAGIDPGRLPPLVATGSVIGPVLPEVAATLGISPDAVVVTGVPDLHAAALGSGCVRDHEAHLSIGTTAWVSCPLPAKRTDLFRQMATVPGLTAESYLLGNNQETAGRCLEWFGRVLDGDRPPAYDELTALAATSPPGAGDVIFTPWLAGERSPVDDRAARGGFHHVSLATTRADLVRSVLEGVALNARWLLEAADHVAGQRLAPLRLVGGGTQSLLWCQILADVTGRPVERVADPLLTGLRGVALLSGLALGAVGWEEVRALVPVDAGLEPVPERRETYDRLFTEFTGLYRAQRRMFARLDGRTSPDA
ncbi:FGGY-family carbohydrate kinase [Nocardioides koreensis]|uniref:FGGY-family carbohydrate kinase n=1 Tax=Nocardioides koreensis TaxID=433651 RepID=A0ABN2Z8W2_9ACTN